ncbi:hypothetical protein [Streptomyces sp. TLI_185]|uniref:hypothetical protein n=1 Tax=Streptomyces sp. TLI_185 TaxID=2485151 RepID=UPI0016152240|nr:hypothetical protein [Streptomyces sp. TLI_185]
MATTPYVPFDEGVQKVVAQAADDHGLEHISLLSGAGHDAQEIAALCPTAMIFVRGEYSLMPRIESSLLPPFASRLHTGPSRLSTSLIFGCT